MKLRLGIAHPRMLKTGLSGLLATAVDMLAMIGLVELFAVQVAVAAFLSATCGAVVNYCVSKFWAFRDPAPIDPKQIALYAMVSLGTAGLVALQVQLFAVVLGIPYVVAKALAAVGAFVVWSYPAQAKIVFPRASLPESSLGERRTAL